MDTSLDRGETTEDEKLNPAHCDIRIESLLVTKTPNAGVAWLTLLLRTREVLGSNLDKEISCPD
jgi:hypothetical protein